MAHAWNNAMFSIKGDESERAGEGLDAANGPLRVAGAHTDALRKAPTSWRPRLARP
jgi:hypothetical protein